MHDPVIETTPSGLQGLDDLARRRRVVAAINVVVYVSLLVWLASILQPAGWTAVNVAIFAAFAIAAPWSVLGVCNALIGLWLLHVRPEGWSRAAPFLAAGDTAAPVTEKTAILMTIRNEDPQRAFARLGVMRADLEATGEGDAFAWFVLSDTTDAAVAAQEEAAFARWREAAGDPDTLHYRRRTDNTGYKAGNVRDFCERWGAGFTFMLPLDADSLMDAAAILRLVRIGHAHPRIGILQSLVVGATTRSAFARIFQFGMRHGMRTYTMGATWWAADCGPFWGHNALIRVAPFTQACSLPTLDDGSHVLSHDQIEAVLMRRAGYEVRVLPLECGSYEENPPTLLEFSRRDLRWCQGNMQYLQLVGLPGLKPMSRFQLVWAVSMFIGVPAWTAIIGLVTLQAGRGELGFYPAGSAAGLYVLFLVFYLAPKLAGFLDVALTPGGVARWGGAGRFAAGALIEVAFSFLIGAATTLRTSLFLLALAFGRGIGWGTQARDAHGISWRDAIAVLWPQLAFGAIILVVGVTRAPGLLVWSLPLTLGYMLAVPFAVVSASPRLGSWMAQRRICAIPEDIDEPAILRALRTAQAPVPPAEPLAPHSKTLEPA